jgi:hypothetical protein
MATKIVNEKMKVSLSVKLGDFTMEKNFTATNINEYDRRTITVGAAETVIANIAAQAAAGTYAINTLRFLAIINNDDTNAVRLRLKKITTGMIKTLGSFAPGNYYKNGIYTGIPFTGGSGTGATGNFSVSSSVIFSLATLIGAVDIR